MWTPLINPPLKATMFMYVTEGKRLGFNKLIAQEKIPFEHDRYSLGELFHHAKRVNVNNCAIMDRFPRILHA